MTQQLIWQHISCSLSPKLGALLFNKAAGRQVAITLSLITHLRTAIFASVAKSTEEKYHLLKTKKLVLLYECAAKLVSFGWSHPKIFSTHSKGRCVFEERQ